MLEQRTDDRRTTWQRHGYVFFIVFGAAMAAFGHLAIRFLGMDPATPANSYPLTVVLLFFLVLIINVVVSYYVALAVSDILYRWRRRMFSN